MKKILFCLLLLYSFNYFANPQRASDAVNQAFQFQATLKRNCSDTHTGWMQTVTAYYHRQHYAE